MEIIDVVITKHRFSSPRTRISVNSFQRLDFWNLGLLVGLEAPNPTYWGVFGAELPRKKGSFILHVSVWGLVVITKMLVVGLTS